MFARMDSALEVLGKAFCTTFEPVELDSMEAACASKAGSDVVIDLSTVSSVSSCEALHVSTVKDVTS